MSESTRPSGEAAAPDAEGAQADEAWYRLDVPTVLSRFRTPREGLSEQEAEQRLERFGANRIGRGRRVSAWKTLLHQFKSPLIYVLLGALVAVVTITLVTGESRWGDAIVIGVVLVVNGTIGFFQEYRAEHAVEKLMRMVSPKASVRRGGEDKRIDADRIVPGDIVTLDEGNVVPADIRLTGIQSLQVNEAALTGESVPVNKTDSPLHDVGAEPTPAERTNMAFMGTAVTSGSAAGVVVATGRQTEIGQIARQVEEAGGTQTPLQRRIQQLAVWITWGILATAALASAIGLLMGRDWAQMLTLAVALAVAAIPAGLPIVVTVALAIGVRRMAEQHAVIRHLPAVDTLGSCTTIVSDKTGTLTQNKMTVRAIYAAGTRYEVTGSAHSAEGRCELEGEPIDIEDQRRRALHETLLVGLLCNNAELPRQDAGAATEPEPRRRDARGARQRHRDGQNNGEQPSGDPMEVALRYAALKAGLDRGELEKRFPRTDEVPFRTERRFMATIHDDTADPEQRPLVAVKGAPEAVLEMCSTVRSDADGADEIDTDAVEQENDALTGQGFRVLAMAIGRGAEAVRAIRRDEPERQLTFAGLQGLLDPPRPSAVEAVDRCHGAGIRVVMVTGDHPRTASAIAHEVHIDRPAEALRRERPAYVRHDTRQSPSEGQEEEADALPEVHSGRELGELSDKEMERISSGANVFARVAPAQKTRLVESLKRRDEIVAVTGDGVNDAPALKAAHIGAAMGSGTDVAKEASDMVITDDNFASVYGAVEQGRTAFRNIRMATFFLLSTGAAMVLVILSALGLGWPLPLLPAQILWCNVVTNGIADVALAFEPGERALYERPPRPPSEGVLDRILLERLVLVGIWLALGTLAVFLWKWGFDFTTWESGNEENLTLARTAALTTMILFQKVHVFNCRSEDVSIFRKSVLANKVLFLGVLASLTVHVAAVYLPWTQSLLSFTPLDAGTWLSAAAVAATAIIVNELHKWLRPRYRFDSATGIETNGSGAGRNGTARPAH